MTIALVETVVTQSSIDVSVWVAGFSCGSTGCKDTNKRRENIEDDDDDDERRDGEVS